MKYILFNRADRSEDANAKTTLKWICRSNRASLLSVFFALWLEQEASLREEWIHNAQYPLKQQSYREFLCFWLLLRIYGTTFPKSSPPHPVRDACKSCFSCLIRLQQKKQRSLIALEFSLFTITTSSILSVSVRESRRSSTIERGKLMSSLECIPESLRSVCWIDEMILNTSTQILK